MIRCHVSLQSIDGLLRGRIGGTGHLANGDCSMQPESQTVWSIEGFFRTRGPYRVAAPVICGAHIRGLADIADMWITNRGAVRLSVSEAL